MGGGGGGVYLCVNGISLVQQHADLVLVGFQHVQHGLEFVADVEFVGVEHDDDHVGALGEPLDHLEGREGKREGKE